MSPGVEYGLISRLTPGFFLVISEAEYARAVEAHRILMLGRDIEERLEILIQNYAEHERGLSQVALRFTIWPFDDKGVDEERLFVTRLVLNLLSSARMYLDHTDHELSQTYGKESDIRKTFNNLRHTEWDTRAEYRIMEAMRNYAQHQGLPAHTIIYESARDDEGPLSDLLRSSATVMINVPRFLADAKPKREVVEAVNARTHDGKMDIPPLVRGYVEGIGHIHTRLRVALGESIGLSDVFVSEMFARAVTALAPILAGTGRSDSLESLRVAKRTSDGTVEDGYWIGGDISDQRTALEKKNAFVDSLARRYSQATRPPEQKTT